MTKSVTVSSELFKCMSYMLHLSRIFGLMPLQWKKLTVGYVVTSSRNYIGYSCTFVLLIVIASQYSLSEILKVDIIYLIKMGTITGRYVTYIDVTIIVTTALVGVLVTSAKLDHFMQYFYHLNMADSLIKPKDLTKGRYKIITIVTMSFLICLLTFQTIIWVNLGSKVQNVYILALYFILYHMSFIFIVVMALVYWHLVYAIKTRLASLSERIVYISRTEKNYTILSQHKEILNLMTALHGNNATIKRNPSSSQTLRNIVRAYLHLVSARNYVCECYGFLVLVLLLGNFIHLVITPYLVRSLIMNTGKKVFIVAQTIWMMGHILRLILIIEPSHGTLMQIKDTSLLVCKLLCNDAEQEVRKLLESLLLCLAQCKIEFTAFDLVKINRGLLTTVTGAATTYLVILFQFN